MSAGAAGSKQKNQNKQTKKLAVPSTKAEHYPQQKHVDKRKSLGQGNPNQYNSLKTTKAIQLAQLEKINPGAKHMYVKHLVVKNTQEGLVGILFR